MLVLGKCSKITRSLSHRPTKSFGDMGDFIVDEINLKIFRFIFSDMVFDIDNLHKGDAKWFWQYLLNTNPLFLLLDLSSLAVLDSDVSHHSNAWTVFIYHHTFKWNTLNHYKMKYDIHFTIIRQF